MGLIFGHSFEQQSHKQACKYVQSNQHNCHFLSGKYKRYTCFMQKINILAILCNCTGRYEALGLVVSDKNIFSCFCYKSLCKTCDPGGRAHLWPQGQNLNKLEKGPLGNAGYQISRLKALWFQTRRFIHISPI